MKLIFEEYFNNLDNWNFEEGFIRNYELQYYASNNVKFSNGLKIYGKKEKIRNKLYDCSSDGEYNWSTKQLSLDYFKNKDNNWENKFHIWKLDWTKEYMRIYIDDELVNEININNIKGNKFKKKYYILLNLAIGRKGLRPNDNDLPFVYEIEYVKVYQN